MLKGLLFIVLLIFIIGAIFLLIVANFIMSIIRRFRRGYYGEDEEDCSAADTTRRRSNQYSFQRNAAYTSTDGQTRQQSSRNNSNARQDGQPEIIVDPRDPNKANRQIISDDEGEYVDFVEEN